MQISSPTLDIYWSKKHRITVNILFLQMTRNLSAHLKRSGVVLSVQNIQQRVAEALQRRRRCLWPGGKEVGRTEWLWISLPLQGCPSQPENQWRWYIRPLKQSIKKGKGQKEAWGRKERGIQWGGLGYLQRQRMLGLWWTITETSWCF